MCVHMGSSLQPQQANLVFTPQEGVARQRHEQSSDTCICHNWFQAVACTGAVLSTASSQLRNARLKSSSPSDLNFTRCETRQSSKRLYKACKAGTVSDILHRRKRHNIIALRISYIIRLCALRSSDCGSSHITAAARQQQLQQYIVAAAAT